MLESSRGGVSATEVLSLNRIFEMCAHPSTRLWIAVDTLGSEMIVFRWFFFQVDGTKIIGG